MASVSSVKDVGRLQESLSSEGKEKQFFQILFCVTEKLMNNADL